MRHSTVLAILSSAVSAYLVEPPTTASPDTVQDCSDWQVVSASDTCASITADWGITTSQFTSYNPSIGANCKLVPANSYCTEQNWGIPPPPTTTSSATPTPTKPGNGIVTPTPIQSGMTENCNKFYYVVKDDGCFDIAAKHNVPTAQFHSWNPFLGTDCKNLWPDTYVCVGVIGFTPAPSTSVTPSKTSTSTSTKTTPTNGINTPEPIQSGLVSNCDAFYLVKADDGCWDIAQKHGITTTQFNNWNPFIGVDCGKLWPNYYVCVSIVGVNPVFSSTLKTTSTVKPSSTSTKPGNGIATPTPIQSGMNPNCKKFYKVISGDGCWGIADKNKINLNDFYKWNPAVGTNCQTLWPDYWVCIGV